MINSETMIYNLTRLEAIDMHLALLHLIHDFEDEIRDPETTEDRRKICESSVSHKWRPLLDKLNKQFELQDAILMEKHGLK